MNRYDYEELHADEPDHTPKYKRRRTSCSDGMCGDTDCPNCYAISEYEDEDEDV